MSAKRCAVIASTTYRCLALVLIIMSVRRCLVIVMMCTIMVGCVSWPNKPRLCFSDELPISPASNGEVRAVKFVKHRLGAGCRPASIECNLQLRRGANGEIEVVATRALVAGDPPACTRLEGGFETYVFSAKGEYVRVILGL